MTLELYINQLSYRPGASRLVTMALSEPVRIREMIHKCFHRAALPKQPWSQLSDPERLPMQLEETPPSTRGGSKGSWKNMLDFSVGILIIGFIRQLINWAAPA